MYNNRKEHCDYTDRDKFIAYTEQEKKPMEMCKGCPMPAKTQKWISKNPERDKKSIKHGIKLIKEFQTT